MVVSPEFTGGYLSPDWSGVALLTIDVQKDFTLPGAPAEIPGTAALVPEIQRLACGFRSLGRPVIHIVRLYLPDGSNVDLCRRRDAEEGSAVVVPGSDGAELVEEIRPSPETRLDAEHLLGGAPQPIGPGEWALYKPRWGAFYRTSLEDHLDSLDVNTVVVCGCNFPNCPRATVYEASERDLRVVLASDATSGLYGRGLQELENIGVKTMRTSEILETMRTSSAVASRNIT